MKIVFVGFSLFCAIALAACGESDDPATTPTTPTGANSCQGTQLTDAQLCQLQCGTTTAPEAEAILGKPDASSGSLIEYTYECTTDGSVIDWDLDFNANGALTVVTATALGSYAGTTVPSCLSGCQQ